MPSKLTQPQRYAAAALFGLALNQAQIHQTLLLGSSYDELTEDRPSNGSSSDSVSDDPLLWVNESSGLLRPIFRFLEIDSSAWCGLEETAGSSVPSHHIGAFLRLLAEENGDVSVEEGSESEHELALSNAVNAMVASIEITPEDDEYRKEKQRAYADEWQEKYATNESKSELENENLKIELEKESKNDNLKTEQEQDFKNENFKNEPEKDCKNGNFENDQENDCKIEDLKLDQEKDCKSADTKEVFIPSKIDVEEKLIEDVKMVSYERKVTVLYELLSACLADIPEDNNNKSKSKRRGKGYDARHRAALRLLTTWFDIKWIKMEAIEIIVALSAMAIIKQEEEKEEENAPKSVWAKWKRGGIIGAAAITGGTLLAITGGLAAPAIAAGFGALAPTLGTIIPVIGAGGFAAVATAAGSVAGSVAVAASFGAAGAGLSGTKMARRTGSVDEFEFKAIGPNHNQGRLAVEILVSGFVFEEQDFVRPWEGQNDNMERYALKWESKHLIAVSTAIQDWLSSTLAMELMKRGAMMTVLSSLLSAFAWPATLLLLTDFIDSKWAIAVNRSDKAGKLLAEVLIKGLQGNRSRVTKTNSGEYFFKDKGFGGSCAFSTSITRLGLSGLGFGGVRWRLAGLVAYGGGWRVWWRTVAAGGFGGIRWWERQRKRVEKKAVGDGGGGERAGVGGGGITDLQNWNIELLNERTDLSELNRSVIFYLHHPQEHQTISTIFDLKICNSEEERDVAGYDEAFFLGFIAKKKKKKKEDKKKRERKKKKKKWKRTKIPSRFQHVRGLTAKKKRRMDGRTKNGNLHTSGTKKQEKKPRGQKRRNGQTTGTKTINMRGLDGIQGPVYVGTGCVFNRQALYGYDPPVSEKRQKMTCDCWPSWCCCCFGGSRKKSKDKSKSKKKGLKALLGLGKLRGKKKFSKKSFVPAYDLEEIEEGLEGYDELEKSSLMSQKNFEKRFGQSPVFITTTLMETGGIPEGTNANSLIKEAIHVISCGYEEKTEWGKEIGWIYGSVTEDILTGFKMHCRGWKSVYCMPKRPAFKGSAPINLSDRLHQVLRWALGSVEIFMSRHCPLWYAWAGKLKTLERLAYINTIVYPFTSIPLLAYCTLPAVCLLTGKFIIPTLNNLASMWFLALFISIIVTGVLELRWSHVSIQDWWRNEQFWVIGGVSAHLFAVFQGLLKVLGGVDTNFTVTSKAADDAEFGELYLFKWTTLLIPPTTLIIMNMVGVVAGVSDAINNGYGSWGPLFGKLFFSFWVIVHLYPFLKGLMGRQNRTPTIVVLWSILLASIFSLVWVRIDPFLPKQSGPILKQCGVEC